MEKEFVSYTQALALKELGFDEPCLAFYDGKNTESFYFNNIRDASGDYIPFQKHDRLKWFGAPLYQQAFRWMREKHGMLSWITRHRFNITTSLGNKEYYRWALEHEVVSSEPHINSEIIYSAKEFNTYEEAEQACLDKLIEICKQDGRESN